MKKPLPCKWAKSLTLFIFLVSFASISKSQTLVFGKKTKIEAGFNVGPSFFLGDLGGNKGKGTRFVKDLNLSQTKVIAGLFVSVFPAEWIGFRAAMQFGKLGASDELIKANGTDELFRKERNLDFRTNISELYVAAEFYPLMLGYNEYDVQPRLRPYGVLGVGAFKYNPQGSLTDNNGVKTWHDLQPLHTEGQGFKEYSDRKEYSLTQINIPIGIGAKYFLSERVNMSFEVLFRKSFTDYIDDVSTTYINPDLFDEYLSETNAVVARRIADKVNGIVTPNMSRNEPGVQRGNPGQNDSYFTTVLKFGVRLGPTSGNMFQKKAMHSLRCPVRI